MKVTLDKNVITLGEVEKAKELQAEYKAYDRGTYETLIRTAIAANLEDEHNNPFRVEKVLEIERVEITKNGYVLTAWISALCRLDYKTIAYISFDGTQALLYTEGGYVAAFTETYHLN